MNLLLDENLSPRLVQLLAAKSIAAQHVQKMRRDLVNRAVEVTGPGKFNVRVLPSGPRTPR